MLFKPCNIQAALGHKWFPGLSTGPPEALFQPGPRVTVDTQQHLRGSPSSSGALEQDRVGAAAAATGLRNPASKQTWFQLLTWKICSDKLNVLVRLHLNPIKKKNPKPKYNKIQNLLPNALRIKSGERCEP